MRFLIVEDEFVARLLLQRFLEPHGQVDMAANGRQAVEAVRRALDEHLPYDLITLDVLLPQLNGRSALRRIRDLEAARGLPLGQGARIIMATGQDDPETVLEAFAQQCDGFLAKPIDHHALLGLMVQFELLDPALIPPPLRRAAVPWKVTRQRLGLDRPSPPPSPAGA